MSEQKGKQPTLKERVIALLNKRAYAYRMVFDPQNVYLESVMADLAGFCHADESTYEHDPRLHALREGRREVFLRIVRYSKLSPEELAKIYAKKGLE